MLTKDLLRVSRAGGGYHPQFATGDHVDLAARVIGIYQGHINEPRERLGEALKELERTSGDFKLVRGFAKLVERNASFETCAPVDPMRARRWVFDIAEPMGVVTELERDMALEKAASGLDADPSAVEQSLYADDEDREVLATVDVPWTPEEMISQYNLSLAQTALFDATEIKVRSNDPKTLVSQVKRLRLLYEIEKTGEGRELVVTGPDALFRSTRRYGTRFARLLRTVAKTEQWYLEATIDDRGTTREMVLSQDDPVHVPGADPIVDVHYDSAIEADFADRFTSLDLDWDLIREPEPLETGARVMIPDFTFDYRYGDFRVYFEIVGFWTPAYVEKKLAQLEHVEDVELLVAVDESLGVGEKIASFDHRVVPYTGSVRIKDIRNAIRTYEEDLAAEASACLPEEIIPDHDVIELSTVAAEYGVSVEAIEDKTFPEHDRVGRTLLRPSMLEEIAERIHAGMTLDEASTVFQTHGIEDTSAVLAHIGYRVDWENLGGGTIRSRT